MFAREEPKVINLENYREKKLHKTYVYMILLFICSNYTCITLWSAKGTAYVELPQYNYALPKVDAAVMNNSLLCIIIMENG